MRVGASPCALRAPAILPEAVVNTAQSRVVRPVLCWVFAPTLADGSVAADSRHASMSDMTNSTDGVNATRRCAGVTAQSVTGKRRTMRESVMACSGEQDVSRSNFTDFNRLQ